MPNIRIIYDNAADRAVLSTTTVMASGLPITNLQSDLKSKVARSTTKSLIITLTWTTAETVAAAILPFTNFSATATIQVQAYTNAADGSPILNTTVTAGSGAVSANSVYGTGVNAFSYGGGSYARIWLASRVLVKKVVITITDTNNASTYIEAGRVVVGDYWEPAGVGVEQGASMSMEDTSKHFRTDAGDLLTDVGTRFRKQDFSLPDLNAADRTVMWDILWGNGMSKPIFISMYPNNVDTKLEQAHMLYGKLVKTPVMGTPYFNRHSANVEVEEI